MLSQGYFVVLWGKILLGENIMMNKRKIPFIDPGAPVDRSLLTADPQGSYTGVPVIPGEQPVQDADDL